MSEMKFEVTTDLAPVINTQIETNFEAVRDWLTEELAPYASMVVTADSISDAKKTRANIRKVGDSIDSQRKAIKKEWMKPYEEYEAKCKELTGIVNEAVQNIDGQIKEMENAEKEAKRKRLESFFNTESSDVSDYISFGDIFDSRWLNASYAETDAAGIIQQKIEETRDGLYAIRGMESPYETAILSEFAKSHSLAKAMAEGRRLEAIQRAEEERRAREAEIKAQTPMPPENVPEMVVGPAQPIQPPVRPVVTEDAPKEKTFSYRFDFPNITTAQAKALKQCLVENGIKYKCYKL
jgi:hypothetical protein